MKGQLGTWQKQRRREEIGEHNKAENEILINNVVGLFAPHTYYQGQSLGQRLWYEVSQSG